MSIEQSIKEHLVGKQAIRNHVGLRVTPATAASGNRFPRILYEAQGSSGTYSFAGSSNIRRVRMRFQCQGRRYKESVDIADALRTALDTNRGDTGTSVTNVRNTIMVNSRDAYEDPEDGRDFGVHNRLVDFDIWYVETAPSP